MTKEQVLNFDPNDWVFRRSSGYAGYDHVSKLNDEKAWIYESTYNEMRRVKAAYLEDKAFLSSFVEHIENEGYRMSFYHNGELIESMLDKKYFPITQ